MDAGGRPGWRSSNAGAIAEKRVRSNDGAPGIDGLTIENFVAHFRDCGKALIEDIRQGNYQPYPVKRVYIEKEDGSLRGLGIPTVFDRVIQQAIVQVITPIFDPEFSKSSFGYRPNRSQHQAIKQVQNYVKEGRRIAVDVDLSKFFDRVNHDYLMTQLGTKIKDKGLLKLISKYLRAGIVENDVCRKAERACPREAPYPQCYPISCWTVWTRNWKSADTSLHAGRMILLFWSMANARANEFWPVLHGLLNVN